MATEGEHVVKILRFIVTCWDGDIYILEGYKSVEEIRERIGGLEWVTMPNGAEIRASAISKIQPYEDYRFQRDSQWRHKRGQHLRLGAKPAWADPQYGEITEAQDIKHIMGGIQNALPEGKSTPDRLTGGQ